MKRRAVVAFGSRARSGRALWTAVRNKLVYGARKYRPDWVSRAKRARAARVLKFSLDRVRRMKSNNTYRRLMFRELGGTRQMNYFRRASRF